MSTQFGKIIFLLVTLHLLGLIACDPFEDDDCTGFSQTFYEVTNLNLENFRLDESTK